MWNTWPKDRDDPPWGRAPKTPADSSGAIPEKPAEQAGDAQIPGDDEKPEGCGWQGIGQTTTTEASERPEDKPKTDKSEPTGWNNPNLND